MRTRYIRAWRRADCWRVVCIIVSVLMPHNTIASMGVNTHNCTKIFLFNPIAHTIKMCIVPPMDKNALMKQLEKRAFDCRIELPALCKKAGVSPTVAYRYLKKGSVPTLPTIGKLERALEV